jgi:hypothetical protein
VADNQIWIRTHQLRDQIPDTIRIGAAKAIVDPNIAAFSPSERREPFPKGRDTYL